MSPALYEVQDFRDRWVVSFTRLLGRPPSDRELRELDRVRDALDLRDNDALWLIIMALQYFRRDLEESVTATLGHLKQVADATAQAAMENARREFQRDFPHVLREVARGVTTPAAAKPDSRRGGQRFLGIGIAAICLALALWGGAWLAYDHGWRAGYRAAWSQAQMHKPGPHP
ncbi:MAG: hypothetical protein WAV07_02870 [Candidatus Contendobacter sp.]